jgi:hypothetical protein
MGTNFAGKPILELEEKRKIALEAATRNCAIMLIIEPAPERPPSANRRPLHYDEAGAP